MYVICSETLGLLFTWHRDSATLLAWNLVGMCCIAGWAAANGLLIFYTLDKLGMLRVAPDMEFRGRWSAVTWPLYFPFHLASWRNFNSKFVGMDILKHGESAYPVDAWIELQYGGGDTHGYLAATEHKGMRCLSLRVLNTRKPLPIREDDNLLSARISSALSLPFAAASPPSQSGAPSISHERPPRRAGLVQ